MIFGVVSSQEDTHADASVDKHVLFKMANLVGEPFAIRFRVDGDTLTLKDLKGLDTPSDRELNNSDNPHFFMGRYRMLDPKQPIANAPLKPGKRRENSGLIPAMIRSSGPPSPATGLPPQVRIPPTQSSPSVLPIQVEVIPSNEIPTLPQRDRIPLAEPQLPEPVRGSSNNIQRN